MLAGDEPAELLACEDDPEQLLAQKQRRAELDRALADLSHEQRVVFVLYELEGFSLPEIAAILAVPLGTATSRLTRSQSPIPIPSGRSMKIRKDPRPCPGANSSSTSS